MAKGRYDCGQRMAAAARRHPNCRGVRRGRGDHLVVDGLPGTRPVPIPQRGLSKREQCQITKQLALAGIALLLALLPAAALVAVLALGATS